MGSPKVKTYGQQTLKVIGFGTVKQMMRKGNKIVKVLTTEILFVSKIGRHALVVRKPYNSSPLRKERLEHIRKHS